VVALAVMSARQPSCFGLLPALRATRIDPHGVLKGGVEQTALAPIAQQLTRVTAQGQGAKNRMSWLHHPHLQRPKDSLKTDRAGARYRIHDGSALPLCTFPQPRALGAIGLLLTAALGAAQRTPPRPTPMRPNGLVRPLALQFLSDGEGEETLVTTVSGREPIRARPSRSMGPGSGHAGGSLSSLPGRGGWSRG
jgi:hypothetical protein